MIEVAEQDQRPTEHYQRPGWLTTNVFNRLVAVLTRLGVSVWGSHVLEVRWLLRAYLKKWKLEVGVFFGGVGPDSTDDELRRIAPDHPVFRLTVSR